MCFGVQEAVLFFNDGNIRECKLFEHMASKVRQYLFEAVKRHNRVRVHKAEKEMQDVEKIIRQKRALLRRKLEDSY